MQMLTFYTRRQETDLSHACDGQLLGPQHEMCRTMNSDVASQIHDHKINSIT